MKTASIGLEELVEALGRHPLSGLSLDPGSPADLGRWLLVAGLLAGRGEPARVLRAAELLRERGLLATDRLAAADPEVPAPLLAEAGCPGSEATAARLVRIARGVEAGGGSLDALARESDGLSELGERLLQLAPGLGAATVSLFLRPLREIWPAAAEIPLHPAARAAAVHLGLIAEDEDAEGEPGALLAAHRSAPHAPPFADLEWALERLGRRSCARNRPDRCPLGERCRAGAG